MVNELESIKKLENELLKVRLEITEKEQEREKTQKDADLPHSLCGFSLFFTIAAFFLENKLIAVILLVITLLIFFFWSLPKANKISRLIQNIKLAKKKKKQLENEIKGLQYLVTVKADKKEVI